jgi:hypothetical protein
MPARPGPKDQKQVFNAEIAATLARFGFSPGATYRDTMHFDFIEGYAAAPGGRAQANMNKNKYGPSGDIPPPAAKPGPSAAKKLGPCIGSAATSGICMISNVSASAMSRIRPVYASPSLGRCRMMWHRLDHLA